MAQIVMRDAHGREVRVSPARDIAHNWSHMVTSCMSGFERANWDSVMEAFLCDKGISQYDLFLTATTYIRFLERCMDPAQKDPQKLLHDIGWFTLHPAAVMAFFYKLGMVSTGMFHHGVRSAYMLGETNYDVEQLAAAGKALMKALEEEDRAARGQSEPGNQGD